MKKFLLSLSLLALPFLGKSQIFQEDWDGNGPGISAWTIIDNDGLTPATQVSGLFTDAWVNLSSADISTLTSNVASSTSYYSPAGASDDWLISPQISISGSSPKLIWQAKAQDPDYPDGYKVMLSTNGGNTVADFNVELFSVTSENSDWVERNVDLSSYIGQTVRLAFVNNSYDMFILHIDNIKVDNNYTPPTPPSCPVLTLPANGETGVAYVAGTAFSWNAPAEGADSYDFYIGTSPGALSLLGNTTSTSVSVTGLDPQTTYYWKIIAKNIGGESVNCTESSFTTEQSPTAPYCGPLTFIDSFFGSDGDEPITLVNFAGINNTTDNSEYVGNYHEVFLDQVATVMQGSNPVITLKGNTAGNYTDSFVVFIDWNQNNDFSDAGETYQITQTITNSDGTDATQATQVIPVPMDATIGNTRMRIKKVFDASNDPNFLDACSGSDYGQAEDYTVNVTAYIAPSVVPDCPTLNSPANNAIDVPYTSTALNWTAPTTGGTVDSYDVYVDTNANPTTLAGNTVNTTWSLTNLLPSTTYYWKVVPKNTVGPATGCSVYSFTTAAPSYCVAGATSTSFEKISNITFGDINNNSTATDGYEDFTSVTGNVNNGQTLNFSASFTGTSYNADQILVWIDFNNDKDFDDAGEQVLVVGPQKSPWNGSITIPSTATLGATRMRVRLHDSSLTPNSTPCGNSKYGQVEDYTLNIGTLAVNDVTKNNIKYYPNPVNDILTIDSPSKLKSVSVYDITGKLVLTKFDLNEMKSQVNLSKLSSGTYMVKVQMENETKTIKILKK